MIAISTEKINEIAQELEAGMLCYYHIETGELASLPDELKHPGFEEEMWRDVKRKIKAERKKYIFFEAMDDRHSFRIMENFINQMPDDNTRQRFEDAVRYKKPFQNFKHLLLQYPEKREQWFVYKNEQNMQWVKDQLEIFNNYFNS